MEFILPHQVCLGDLLPETSEKSLCFLNSPVLYPSDTLKNSAVDVDSLDILLSSPQSGSDIVPSPTPPSHSPDMNPAEDEREENYNFQFQNSTISPTDITSPASTIESIWNEFNQEVPVNIFETSEFEAPSLLPSSTLFQISSPSNSSTFPSSSPLSSTSNPNNIPSFPFLTPFPSLSIFSPFPDQTSSTLTSSTSPLSKRVSLSSSSSSSQHHPILVAAPLTPSTSSPSSEFSTTNNTPGDSHLAPPKRCRTETASGSGSDSAGEDVMNRASGFSSGGRRASSQMSGYDFPEGTNKHQQRLIKNRQAASLSRQRKKEYLDQLEKKLKMVEEENSNLKSQLNFVRDENSRLNNQISWFESLFPQLNDPSTLSSSSPSSTLSLPSTYDSLLKGKKRSASTALLSGSGVCLMMILFTFSIFPNQIQQLGIPFSSSSSSSSPSVPFGLAPISSSSNTQLQTQLSRRKFTPSTGRTLHGFFSEKVREYGPPLLGFQPDPKQEGTSNTGLLSSSVPANISPHRKRFGQSNFEIVPSSYHSSLLKEDFEMFINSKEDTSYMLCADARYLWTASSPSDSFGKISFLVPMNKIESGPEYNLRKFQKIDCVVQNMTEFEVIRHIK